MTVLALLALLALGSLPVGVFVAYRTTRRHS